MEIYEISFLDVLKNLFFYYCSGFITGIIKSVFCGSCDFTERQLYILFYYLNVTLQILQSLYCINFL